MTGEDDLLASLAELETPELNPEFAARVRRLAHAELPSATSGETIPLRLLLSGAVVPSLLVSAAVVRSTESVETVTKIFVADGESAKE